jgi:hypothetical protein
MPGASLSILFRRTATSPPDESALLYDLGHNESRPAGQ